MFGCAKQSKNLEWYLLNNNHIVSYVVEDLQNGGEDCWEGCNHIEGKCDWCGVGNFCCRKNREGNGCDGNVGGKHNHQCVVSGTGMY